MVTLQILVLPFLVRVRVPQLIVTACRGHGVPRSIPMRLGYGVMVTLQILVLPFLVRVRVPQLPLLPQRMRRRRVLFFFVAPGGVAVSASLRATGASLQATGNSLRATGASLRAVSASLRAAGPCLQPLRASTSTARRFLFQAGGRHIALLFYNFAVMKKLVALFLLLVAVGAVAWLYAVDPSRAAVMPQCPFRLLTGWDCPGCGFLRATHALLHGRPAEAWAYNPFLVVSLPYLLLLLATEYVWRGPRRQQWRRVLEGRPVVWGYLAAAVLWTLWRNLPFYHSAAGV